MKRAIALMTITVSVSFLPLSATVINIPDDYLTIQEGIDASADGDTVLVQPGTYVENINFDGHNIVLGSLFMAHGDRNYISSTIIDGGSAETAVTFNSGEDSLAVITGFTIQNGLGMCSGGGIKCTDSGPTIISNIIRWNDVIGCDPGGRSGGGIYCLNSNAIIINNSIEENIAADGGGIYSSDFGPVIINNVINQNQARGSDILGGGQGAGIYAYNTNVDNNIIINNSTYAFWSASGGGIWAYNATITNNMIMGNSAGGDQGTTGGGVACSHSNIYNNVIYGNYSNKGSGGISGDTSIIVNNLVCNNIAVTEGGGLAADDATIVMNSVIWGNIAEFSPQISGGARVLFCDIEGGWPGEGNISADALIRNATNGDFHLMSLACGDSVDSPCIDTGNPDIQDSMLNCSWGLGTILSDMGAYGGGDSVQVSIDNQNKQISAKFSLLLNCPNPFNASTTISYSLPEQSEVRIEIFNILGQKAATLLDGVQHAGDHSITWRADNFPSGVYFARLDTAAGTENIKMVLLK